MTLPLTPGIIV